MQLAYGLALGLSAIALVLMAVTRFGTNSTIDRVLCGLGGAAVGWYSFHLLFLYEGGKYVVFVYAFILPVYVAYRLIRGFLNRAADREKRAAYTAATSANDEWRSTRRW